MPRFQRLCSSVLDGIVDLGLIAGAAALFTGLWYLMFIC